MLRINRRHNLRDLGGFPVGENRKVRYGVLYRSGNLYNLSKKDSEKLINAGISLIIDIRTPIEVEENPDVILPGVTYIYTPFLTDSTVGITHNTGSNPVLIVKKMRHDKQALLNLLPNMEELYLKMVTDSNTKKQIGKALSELIDAVLDGKRVLFHCTAGKDRTGVLAALVLSILGVARTDVLKDYIKTNRSAYAVAVKKGLVVGALTHSFSLGLTAYQLFMAQQRHLIKTMSTIRKKYNTVEQFVTEDLGIEGEKLNRFKELMTVPLIKEK